MREVDAYRPRAGAPGERDDEEQQGGQQATDHGGDGREGEGGLRRVVPVAVRFGPDAAVCGPCRLGIGVVLHERYACEHEAAE